MHGIQVNVTNNEKKLCLFADLMVNFSVSYETTDNKVSVFSVNTRLGSVMVLNILKFKQSFFHFGSKLRGNFSDWYLHSVSEHGDLPRSNQILISQHFGQQFFLVYILWLPFPVFDMGMTITWTTSCLNRHLRRCSLLGLQPLFAYWMN